MATSPQQSKGPPRPGVAILFVEDHVSFEEALSVPEFRALARAGGVGLMTTKVGTGDPTESSYLTIGAGAHVPGSGTRFLLARALHARGVLPCLNTDLPLPLVQAGPALGLLGPLGSVSCPLAFSQVLSHGPIDELDGIIVQPFPTALALNTTAVYADGATLRIDRSPALAGRPADRAAALRDALLGEGELLRRVLGPLGATRTLVMVVAPMPSAEMDRVGDEVPPLIMAEGPADRLLSSNAPSHALTSDTTRHDGLVANVDVAPTVLAFFGIPTPAEMDGSPIHATDAPAPFALHRLHLEQRRIRLPIQLAEVAFLVFVFIAGVPLLIALHVRGSLPPRVCSTMAFLALCATAFPIALLSSGLLPHLTYAWVVPFLVIVTVGIGVLSRMFTKPGSLEPFAFVGAVGLAFVVLDGVLGGRAFTIPVFGGTMLDGVRYYGLGNSFIALVIASALFVAVWLEPFPGFVVLFGAGLFLGFPRLGANIGGAIALFAAAGMWWVARERRRVRLPEVLIAGAVVALGTAIVLAVNRFLPGTPTHLTHFVERSSRSLGSALAHLRYRLGVGARQIARYPPGILPLVGLPAVMVVVLRVREGPVGGALDLQPWWREMLVTLILASVIAYLASDTGTAAAAPAFLYAMTGIAYPAFLSASKRARSPTIPSRT
jgi:hypothetical protein